MARPEQNECKCGGFIFMSPTEIQHTLPVCDEFARDAKTEGVSIVREGTALRLTDTKRVVKTAVYVRENVNEDDDDETDVDSISTSVASHDWNVEGKQGTNSTLRD